MMTESKRRPKRQRRHPLAMPQASGVTGPLRLRGLADLSGATVDGIADAMERQRAAASAAPAVRS